MLRGATPLRLVLVGAGPLEAALRAQAAAAGLAAEFPGVVPQQELPRVYAGADAFVLASFTEGHPKVLLEAMSAGVPVVASDCAGNRSLVADGRTGLLFDPARPDELAERLGRVLGDHAPPAAPARPAREPARPRPRRGARARGARAGRRALRPRGARRPRDRAGAVRRRGGSAVSVPADRT